MVTGAPYEYTSETTYKDLSEKAPVELISLGG